MGEYDEQIISLEQTDRLAKVTQETNFLKMIAMFQYNKWTKTTINGQPSGNFKNLSSNSNFFTL